MKLLVREARRWDEEEGEYREFEGAEVEVSDEDVFMWNITLPGPEDSAYEGGVFYVEVKFTGSYPSEPPSITFATKIYHPSIKLDGADQGKLCKDALKAVWKSTSKTRSMDIIEFLITLLKDPPVDSPVEDSIAKELNEDKDKFFENAKIFTKKYAGGSDDEEEEDDEEDNDKGKAVKGGGGS